MRGKRVFSFSGTCAATTTPMMVCPARLSALAHASRVAPVTITSSTRTTRECGGKTPTRTPDQRRARRLVRLRVLVGPKRVSPPMRGNPKDSTRRTGSLPERSDSASAIKTVGQNPRRKKPRAEGGTGTRTTPGFSASSRPRAPANAGVTSAPEIFRKPPSLMATITRRRAPRKGPPEITGTPHNAVATASRGAETGPHRRLAHLAHRAVSGRKHPAHDTGARRPNSDGSTRGN